MNGIAVFIVCALAFAINMNKMRGAVLTWWTAVLLVVGWIAVATGQFHADTLQDYVTVLDPGTETETAVLPCKLVRDDPSWNNTMDLLWYKDVPGDPVRHEQHVYMYHQNYDGALKYGDERFTRTIDNPEEMYYLRISNARASDQGRYCCVLNFNFDWSVDCIDLHYKYLDPSKFTFKCDKNSDATADIPLPATVIAVIRDLYPAENEPSDRRQFDIIDADKVTRSSTTNFVHGSNGRYHVSLTYTVTEPGAYGFFASLSYKWGNYDEKYIECTYIPDVPAKKDDPDVKALKGQSQCNLGLGLGLVLGLGLPLLALLVLLVWRVGQGRIQDWGEGGFPKTSTGSRSAAGASC